MLKTIRKEKGLSQRELAAKCNMSQTFLSNVENGHCDPSLSTLKRLAKGLGITVSKLVEEPKP